MDTNRESRLTLEPSEVASTQPLNRQTHRAIFGAFGLRPAPAETVSLSERDTVVLCDPATRMAGGALSRVTRRGALGAITRGGLAAMVLSMIRPTMAGATADTDQSTQPLTPVQATPPKAAALALLSDVRQLIVAPLAKDDDARMDISAVLDELVDRCNVADPRVISDPMPRQHVRQVSITDDPSVPVLSSLSYEQPDLRVLQAEALLTQLEDLLFQVGEEVRADIGIELERLSMIAEARDPNTKAAEIPRFAIGCPALIV